MRRRRQMKQAVTRFSCVNISLTAGGIYMVYNLLRAKRHGDSGYSRNGFLFSGSRPRPHSPVLRVRIRLRSLHARRRARVAQGRRDDSVLYSARRVQPDAKTRRQRNGFYDWQIHFDVELYSRVTRRGLCEPQGRGGRRWGSLRAGSALSMGARGLLQGP